MSEYIELYKQFRPKTWDEVIGQDIIVESLKTAVIENKLPTAFLLCGPAGTGKTTMAKILAKAVNCDNTTDGNPCNNCETCQAIDSDRQAGVTYVSMANNGSVEDVRRIMEQSKLILPLKKQVFILDEVQNLSPAAQDASLIGIESENQKSLFILCTTDPEKIKSAVLSRVQQRNLSRVDNKTLAQHLINIIKKTNLQDKVKKEDIISSVQTAEGSVRNAIRNLEVIISNGELPSSYSKQIIKAISSGNPLEIYKISSELSDNSQNFTKTLEQIYRDFASILQIKSGGSTEFKSIKEMANDFTGNFVLTSLSEIGDCLNRISNKAVDTRILAEITLVKLTMIHKKGMGK